MGKFLDNKTPEELFVGQLTTVIADLAAKKKSLENIVEELRTQMVLVETEYAHKRDVLLREHDKLVRGLQAEVEPLQAQKAQVALLQSQITELKQRALDAARDIKTTKGIEIQKADALLADASARLAKVIHVTNEYKAKVATL